LNFVVDASVSLSWYLPGEGTARTEVLRGRLGDAGGLTAFIWPAEVSNVLLQSERAGRIAPADTMRIGNVLRSLPITVDLEGASLSLELILNLARSHGLTSYDASYLELAVRSGLPLATNDGDLRAAAVRMGVEVL